MNMNFDFWDKLPIQDCMRMTLESCEYTIDRAEREGLENDQILLDFLDKMNEFSVRH